MRILIVNSNHLHPINLYLTEFCKEINIDHDINIVRKVDNQCKGEILFLISCEEIIPKSVLENFDYSLVLHASDLPRGRGWSPHIWEIIEGSKQITVSMIDASANVDRGGIYKQEIVEIPKTAIWNEINELLFKSEIKLMKYAIQNYKKMEKTPQDPNITPTYYRRRTSNDSELDIRKPLIEQFDLLRVCDPNRYPAFFKIHGIKFKVVLEKL